MIYTVVIDLPEGAEVLGVAVLVKEGAGILLQVDSVDENSERLEAAEVLERVKALAESFRIEAPPAAGPAETRH